MSEASPVPMIDSDVSDGITEHVRDELCSEWGTFLAHTAGRFRVAYLAEAGYSEDEDEAPLLVARESDGALFAVQVRAIAIPVPWAPGRADALAALPDNGCWVRWSPCGCPVAVATARNGDDVYYATEGEIWRSQYADWSLAERDKAAGYRVELMTHERYRAEVAPKMLARCPHGAGPEPACDHPLDGHPNHGPWCEPEPSGQMELPEVAG